MNNRNLYSLCTSYETFENYTKCKGSAACTAITLLMYVCCKLQAMVDGNDKELKLTFMLE